MVWEGQSIFLLTIHINLKGVQYLKETESRNLKEEILTVTGRMFLEYGYSGTTFQKIADELNITKGAITYHFKNKFMIKDM